MVAVKLRALRLSSKMHQSHLAEMLGVERSTISRWESGAVTPSVIMINRLAEIFGVGIE